MTSKGNINENNNFKCGICYKMFDCENYFENSNKAPRTLQCNHSFCSECIGKIPSNNNKQVKFLETKETITCPSCRQVTSLSVADLPIDMTIIQAMRSNNLNPKLSEGLLCSNCDDNFSQVKCIPCNLYLCEGCLILHNGLKINRSHAIINSNDVESNKYQLPKDQVIFLCKLHPSNEISLFCEKCHAEMCKDCVVNHSLGDHEVIPLSEALTKYGENQSNVLEIANNFMIQLDELLVLNRNKLEAISKIRETKEDEVKDLFEVTVNKLKDAVLLYRNEVLDGYHNLFVSVEQLLNENIFQIESKKYEISLVYDNAVKNINAKSIMNIISSTANLKSSVNPFLTLNDQTKLQQDSDNFKFTNFDFSQLSNYSENTDELLSDISYDVKLDPLEKLCKKFFVWNSKYLKKDNDTLKLQEIFPPYFHMSYAKVNEATDMVKKDLTSNMANKENVFIVFFDLFDIGMKAFGLQGEILYRQISIDQPDCSSEAKIVPTAVIVNQECLSQLLSKYVIQRLPDNVGESSLLFESSSTNDDINERPRINYMGIFYNKTENDRYSPISENKYNIVEISYYRVYNLQ